MTAPDAEQGDGEDQAAAPGGDTPSDDAPAAAGEGQASQRPRRRRRRRGARDEGERPAAEGAATSQGAEVREARDAREARPRQERSRQQGERAGQPSQPGQQAQRQGQPSQPGQQAQRQGERPRQQGERAGQPSQQAQRQGQPSQQAQRQGERGPRPRDERTGQQAQRQGERGPRSRDERGERAGRPAPARQEASEAPDLADAPGILSPASGAPARFVAAPRAADAWDDDDETSAEPRAEWGKDDDRPAEAITLAALFPDESDDLDPASLELEQQEEPRPTRGDVVTVCGVRFAHAGRVFWFDCQAAWYAVGDRLLCDSERGPRVGTVVVASERRQTTERGLRRVLRVAAEADEARAPGNDERGRAVLRMAKDRVAAMNLPAKVFRAESHGGGRNERVVLYLTTEERVELRDLVRDLGNATGARIELRQLGARDEAKAIGGIGSCGLTLCCTTWLPEFVPVSIKMAKDQGLVLNPTKVAGQCGRLKCCLVYEQAGYAELRKGLPKLGKRVITTRGEGRVVEVDVLRQRVRVSYGPGESEVLPATEMRPMFPSGNQPSARGAGRSDDAGGSIDEDLEDDDATGTAMARLDDPPTATGGPTPEDPGSS